MNLDSPEAAAKVALLTDLRASGRFRSHAVISELAVEKWARRADLVTVGSTLTAYEIKTKADRLTRLSDQLATYSTVFDQVYAVVATKHMNAVMSRVPTFVGLKELVEFGRGLEVRPVREAAQSPELTVSATLNLLPVAELSRLIRAQTNEHCTGLPRAALMEIAQTIPLQTSRTHLRQFLRDKHASSTVRFVEGAAGRRIASADLSALSIWEKQNRLNESPSPCLAEWLSTLSATKAFGPVPEDVRNLLGFA